MEAIFEWDRVLSLDPAVLRNLKKDKVDMIVDMFISTKEWDIEGKAPNKIIHIFHVFQALLRIKNYEVCETQSLLEKVGEEQVKTEVKLLAKVEMLEQRLQRYSAAERSQHVADFETDELKEQLESEQAELIKSIGKIDREKSKRKQLATELQEADTKISTLKQEVRQYEQTIFETEEEVRKLQREIKRLRAANLDLKDSFRIYGDDLNAKSGRLLRNNKKELEECSDKLQKTESKNKELQNDKVQLINLLQESEVERERIILKLNYVKGQILETDQTLDWLRTEKDAAEDKFRNLKKDIYSMTEKFDEIAADASERVQECKKMLHEKEHVIFEQQRIIFELKHDLQLAIIDMKGSSVGVLHQAIEDRDKTIDVLCEKVEYYTKRIEKNVQAFEQQETKGKKGKVICFLQFQLEDAEQRANNAEQALYHAKVMIKEKHKEVQKVSDILRNYTAGTKGLILAFKDLEKWKHKMKVKPCDVEPLTTAFNHLEMRVKDLMEENLDVKNMQKEGHIKEFYIPKGHRRLTEDDKTEQKTHDLGARHKTNHLERHNPAESQLDRDGQWQSVLNSFTDTSSNTDEEPRPGQFLHNEISNLSKEMEIVKRKLDRFQKIWVNISPVQRERAVSRENIGSGSTGMSFAPKQASSLEIEESNESQRAAGGSEIITTSLSTLKERNAALESQVKELTKIHLDDIRVEQQLRSELANRNHRGVSETNSGRIAELERSEAELRMKVFELQGKCSSFNEKILSLKQESNIAQQERKEAEDGRTRAEEKAEELKCKNAELEKAVAKLKDKKAAQDTNAERQETYLQDIKKKEMDNNKSMDLQKDEITFLKSLVKKKEQTILSLGENQLVLQEACQLAEGKLQEELKQNQQKYHKIHTELLNCVAAIEGDAIPLKDTTILPVVEQVMYALGKFKERLSSTLATRKHLEEKLKEKEDALKKAEHKILSSDRVISDLRLELSSRRQQLHADQALAQELAPLSKAKETMNNLQLQLERKDEVIKKNTERFTRSLNERNESMNKYQNELAELQHKLNLEMHTGQRYKNETEEMKQEINSFNSELDVQMALRTECLNERAELQNKLAQKKIELETVNKDLLELRQKYEDISSKLSRENTSQKRELHFMHQQAEREAEELKVHVKYLKDKLQAAEKTIKELRKNEDSMRNKMKDLTQEIEFFQKRQKVIENEKGMYRRESQRLSVQLRRLNTVPLKQLQERISGPTTEELQAKIRVLESEFEYRLKTKTEVNKEMIEFRMKKTWQKRLEILETCLKQKEEENESLLKRQSTLRNLLQKLEKEKRVLQNKLKLQGYGKHSQM